MAYTIQTNQIGVPAIALTSDSSSPAVPIGTIVRASDPNYGEGEFIYLPGVASNTIGSLVTYTVGSTTVSGITPAAVALTVSTKNQGRAVAVSMAANTGTATYSWYAIKGTVPVKKTAVKIAPAQKVFLSGTSGRVYATTASGKQVLGSVTSNTATVASATSTVLVAINRPTLMGIVT